MNNTDLRLRATLPVVLFAVLAAGCGSAARQSTTYLTLTQVPPAHTFSAQPLVAIMVGAVDIPPSIDRLSLTTSAGGAALKVSDDARWSAPLGGLIRLALARDLAAALPQARVLMPGDPTPPQGALEVRVSLQQFLPAPSGRVTLDADWSVLAPQAGRIEDQGRFHVDLPGSPAPAAEAATLSAALGKLADALVDHSLAAKTR